MADIKSRNPELTAFLRQKRGDRTTMAMDELIGGQYWRYENHGYLPRQEERIQKLAEALGCSTEVLRSYVPEPATPNVLPLVRAIAATGCETLTQAELEYLFQKQEHFEATLSPRLIEELVNFRRMSES